MHPTAVGLDRIDAREDQFSASPAAVWFDFDSDSRETRSSFGGMASNWSATASAQRHPAWAHIQHDPGATASHIPPAISAPSNPLDLARHSQASQRPSQERNSGHPRLAFELAADAEQAEHVSTGSVRLDEAHAGVSAGWSARPADYLADLLRIRFLNEGWKPEHARALTSTEALATLKSYRSPIGQFMEYAVQEGIPYYKLSHADVGNWIMGKKRQKEDEGLGGLAYSTLRHYLWAVRHVLPPPTESEARNYKTLMSYFSMTTAPAEKTHRPIDMDLILTSIRDIDVEHPSVPTRHRNIVHKATFLLGFYGFCRPSDIQRAIRPDCIINGKRYKGTRFVGAGLATDLLLCVYGPKERRSGQRIVKEVLIKRADTRFARLCPVVAMELYFRQVYAARMRFEMAESTDTRVKLLTFVAQCQDHALLLRMLAVAEGRQISTQSEQTEPDLLEDGDSEADSFMHAPSSSSSSANPIVVFDYNPVSTNNMMTAAVVARSIVRQHGMPADAKFNPGARFYQDHNGAFVAPANGILVANHSAIEQRHLHFVEQAKTWLNIELPNELVRSDSWKITPHSLVNFQGNKKLKDYMSSVGNDIQKMQWDLEDINRTTNAALFYVWEAGRASSDQARRHFVNLAAAVLITTNRLLVTSADMAQVRTVKSLLKLAGYQPEKPAKQAAASHMAANMLALKQHTETQQLLSFGADPKPPAPKSTGGGKPGA
ncbi:hypothetical protein GQ42DRAFT_157488 [Ramicandelaber brevisporus]|nr:hypothetical protein GQ42DRAFT_157488 [Ramicandelaber brevisporus]